MVKRLSAASLAALRAFWQEQGIRSFYFYSPMETDPPFSHDPTGAATAGRYRVRFASQWNETYGIGRPEVRVDILETPIGGVLLMDDLALLIDKSGSLSDDDMTNEKAAACTIVDLVTPLDAGGIVVYSFGNGGWGPVLDLPLSHDAAAIKAAINAIVRWGDTPLYATIWTAATQTTAKNLILMTDGHDDISPLTSMADAIAACVARGVKCHTIGFGNADLNVLQQISAGTGGVAYSSVTSENLSALATSLINEVGVSG
jgi:uncharacterized protein with von Willebrand factor type A (vWA) domain